MHHDSPWAKPPLDYAPEDDLPPPQRLSRVATAAWFIAAFIVGMFTGMFF